MKTYNELRDEDRRLVILRMLQQAPDYRGNQYLLHAALPGMGHAVGMDRVKTDLAWLCDQGLITREEVGGVMIGRLTDAGLDTANGVSTTPGVKRPAPGAQ